MEENVFASRSLYMACYSDDLDNVLLILSKTLIKFYSKDFNYARSLWARALAITLFSSRYLRLW